MAEHVKVVMYGVRQLQTVWCVCVGKSEMGQWVLKGTEWENSPLSHVQRLRVVPAPVLSVPTPPGLQATGGKQQQPVLYTVRRHSLPTG